MVTIATVNTNHISSTDGLLSTLKDLFVTSVLPSALATYVNPFWVLHSIVIRGGFDLPKNPSTCRWLLFRSLYSISSNRNFSDDPEELPMSTHHSVENPYLPRVEEMEESFSKKHDIPISLWMGKLDRNETEVIMLFLKAVNWCLCLQSIVHSLQLFPGV